MGPPGGIDLSNHHTIRGRSTMELHLATELDKITNLLFRYITGHTNSEVSSPMSHKHCLQQAVPSFSHISPSFYSSHDQQENFGYTKGRNVFFTYS